jgi:hypothetical protein
MLDEIGAAPEGGAAISSTGTGRPSTLLARAERQ